MSLFSNNGIRYLVKIHSEIGKVKREIVAMEQENKAQEAKLQEVYNNPRLIEIYARSKLGMVKPDEIVYEINTSAH